MKKIFCRITMQSLGIIAMCLLLTSISWAQTAVAGTKNYHLMNGQWFDGKKFRTRDFYVVDGKFTSRKPSQIDEVVDLKKGFVVPPFADAHTHNFDGAYNLEPLIKSYLQAGIFYAKVQTNPRSGAREIASKINRPDSVDVAYAHGGLTSSYGHGVEVYEGLALFYRTGGFDAEQIKKVRASKLRENDAYYIIDTAEDVEQKWPRILAGKPDFIKVYLLTSENHAQQIQRTDTVGDRGIDPKLTSLIVQKAHAAGLRVSAHVDTKTDYHIALQAGVDEMAHLPGYYIEGMDTKPFEVDEADIKETARRGVWVVPAPVAYDNFDPTDKNYDAALQQRTDAVRKRNLQLMKKYRVKIAFGSDRYGRLVDADVIYLQKLNIYSNAELLKIWCEDTPQTIFPQRKLGKFADGYEASFLVLEKNPLVSFTNIKTIKLRCKQGIFLSEEK